METGKLLWTREFIFCPRKCGCRHIDAIFLEWIHGGWVLECCQSIVSFSVFSRCVLDNSPWSLPLYHLLIYLFIIYLFSILLQPCSWKLHNLFSTLLYPYSWKLIYADFNTRAGMEDSTKRRRTHWERNLGIRVFISYIHSLPFKEGGI